MTGPLFRDHTTMRVGGGAREWVRADDDATLVDAARAVWESGEEWLVLGGGSNLVVADEGFDGSVVQVATRGIYEHLDSGPGAVRLRVAAGEPWDALVDYAVERGYVGIEAMTGIPGSVGAAPVQNIGAYGQEVAQTLLGVDFLDAETGGLEHIAAPALGLGYRTSALKRGRRGVVVGVELLLQRSGSDADAPSRPIAYAQLAAALERNPGDRAPIGEVRAAVRALRAGKGMLLDPHDPDSVSSGSFFTNPIVRESFARGLPEDAPRWPVSPVVETVEVTPIAELDAGAPLRLPPPVPEALVKLSAAWLIERSGVSRGFRLPGSRAAVSGKHTLALVNTGGASSEEIAQLSRYIESRVQAEFGVLLTPEPVLVGLER